MTTLQLPVASQVAPQHHHRCNRQVRGHERRRRASVHCRAAANPAETLEGADKQSWDSCQQYLEELGIPSEDADKQLKKAFAWTKGYWAAEKPEPEVPNRDQIAEAISFLEKQGVTGDDLPKVLKQFPQVMGLKPDSMKGNINKMEKQYFVRGPALKNVIKRKPQALGFNWDCEGDCAGNCPRCWVHF